MTIEETPEPVTPPPAPPTPAPETVSMTSEAFKARLQEERGKGVKALLKELGLDKPEDLKSAYEKLKTMEAEKLSEFERIGKELEAAKKGSEEGLRYQKIAKDLFDEQWAKLPENVRADIEAEAGDSFDERLKLARFAAKLTPPSKPAPVSKNETKPAPEPKPVKTAHERYQDLLKADPLGASFFLNANRVAVEETRPASDD